MSTAVVERIAEQPKKAELAVVSAPPRAVQRKTGTRIRSFLCLLPGPSRSFCPAFIGSILAWLALRHSGAWRRKDAPLISKRLPAGWRIVHDHISAAEYPASFANEHESNERIRVLR